MKKNKWFELNDKLKRAKEFIIGDRHLQEGLEVGAKYTEFYITVPYINNDYYKINDRIAFIDEDMFHVIAHKTFKLREIHFFRDKQNYDIMLEPKNTLTREEERRIVNNLRKAKGEKYLPLSTSELTKLLYLPTGHFIEGKEKLKEYLENELQINDITIKEIKDEHYWGYEIQCEASDNPDFHFIYHYLKDAEGTPYIYETKGQVFETEHVHED